MVAILVVLTIVLFVAADLILQRVRARRASAVPARPREARVADLLLPSLQPERFALPGGLFFHPGHTWVNLLFSGQTKVGVDDFVQRLLGKVDAITLPPVGVEIKEGQPFVAFRQGGRTAMLAAPIDGVVCAVNTELTKAPGLLKRDPYTRGWLVALQPRDLTADMSRLVVGDKALDWLRRELARFQDFLRETVAMQRDVLVGVTAADGGLTADGLLERLDEERWTEFQSRFLRA
jgi:glycine cleavage system H lipoate-binding protein